MQLSTATQDRLRKAFSRAHARYLCLHGHSTRSDVVFQAMVDATDILRRLPDPERWSPRPTRSPWPGLIRTPEEREEAYWHQIWMVADGLRPWTH